jgi:GT2 family glycosyltransferase
MSPAALTADASVIIPNWNGEAHLRDCLDSVRNQGRSPSETILVDNGSTDGSLQLVKLDYPWVTIIPLPENVGFSAAVNRGIQACRSRFVALLDNDTQLDPDWLDILVDALQTHHDAGFVGCKMLNFYKRNIIDDAGSALSPGGIPLTRGAGEPDDGRYSIREYIFSVSTGAAMYRRELFDRVGLFDEDFDSCYEDSDLAFRAQLAGFKCLYVPEALCYHKRGVAGGISSPHLVRIQERNLTAFSAKDFPWPVLLLKSLRIVGARTRRLWRAVRAGLAGPAFGGCIDGLRVLPHMLAKRRKVQRLRTVRLGYVFSLMRGGVVR